MNSATLSLAENSPNGTAVGTATASDPVKARLSYDFKLSQFPVEKKADYNLLAAYFNIDNGGGKLRGIHAEGNFAAVPILREMLSPFASMGAGAVVARPGSATYTGADVAQASDTMFTESGLTTMRSAQASAPV